MDRFRATIRFAQGRGPMKRSCLLLGVFLSGWSVLALPAFVGNWSFLTQSGPYDVFNRDDFEIFKTTANEVLDKGKDGETIPWGKPEIRSRGYPKNNSIIQSRQPEMPSTGNV